MPTESFIYIFFLGTVAPILVLESRESVNIWEDVNIIVPIVAAIIALTVVIGVAVCVCVKKRHVAGNYGKFHKVLKVKLKLVINSFQCIFHYIYMYNSILFSLINNFGTITLRK